MLSSKSKNDYGMCRMHPCYYAFSQRYQFVYHYCHYAIAFIREQVIQAISFDTIDYWPHKCQTCQWCTTCGTTVDKLWLYIYHPKTDVRYRELEVDLVSLCEM